GHRARRLGQQTPGSADGGRRFRGEAVRAFETCCYGGAQRQAARPQRQVRRFNLRSHPLSVDYHQLLRDSLTRLPTVAATIDSVRKAVQDRGEIVILYFNFDRYSKVEEVYGWEKLDSVLETTGEAMRDYLSKSPLASSRLMVAFPNDDDFVFFHVPQDDTPAATDAEITELTAGLK